MSIEKAAFRKQMLKKRNAISDDLRIKKNKLIYETLVKSELYKNAEVIFSYVSFNSEADTSVLNKTVYADGKTLALPKVLSKTEMQFYNVKRSDKLIMSRMGILEPDEQISHIQIPNKKTLIIMPGLAFDSHRYRMGYGGGYYDRYLAQYSENIVSVMIAYEEQKANKIPHDTYDQKPDYIITDEGFYR